MTRLVATVVAILLIIGAVIVRSVIDDDGGGGVTPGERVTRVVCSDELRAACEGLRQASDVEVKIEAATVTAGRLTGAPVDEPGLEIWVVPSPWPAIVDEGRARDGLPPLFGDPVPLGRSDLAAVVPESIGPCDWRCLGERATGDLRIGSRSLDSGLGVLHLAAFAAGRLDRTDFASNDLDTATQAYLRGIDDAVDEVPDPVTRMLQIRASFDVALSHRAEAEAALASATEDRKVGLSVTYPDPVISVVAVAAPIGERAVPPELGTALLELGWSEPSDDPTGVPKAGVLTALRGIVR